MENRDEIEKYWQKKAQELGESILYKSITQSYQSDFTQRFGILFLTKEHLIFEYSKRARRSILEGLFMRKKDEGLDQVLKIPRNNIKMAKLINLNLAKKWVRRGLTPAEVMAESSRKKRRPIWDLITSTCLGICTENLYLAFETPSDREWAALLSEK